jgi:hypothetical protein
MSATLGVFLKELEPSLSSVAPGESLRRLQVVFPARVVTHAPTQTFDFDREGLLRRLDYRAPHSDHVTITQVYSGHQRFSDGIADSAPLQRIIAKYVTPDKADDGDGPLALEIVVIHGEIIDSDEFELEFIALAEAYEGMRQPAIYGFSTIAAYDCRDFEFSHLLPGPRSARNSCVGPGRLPRQ